MSRLTLGVADIFRARDRHGAGVNRGQCWYFLSALESHSFQPSSGLSSGLCGTLQRGGNVIVDYVRITLRRLDAGMAKRLLHKSNVALLPQQLGREIVSEVVKAEADELLLFRLHASLCILSSRETRHEAPAAHVRRRRSRRIHHQPDPKGRSVSVYKNRDGRSPYFHFDFQVRGHCCRALRVAADIGLRAHYGNHVHRRAKVINLMDALRRSVEAERGGSAKRQAPAAERPKEEKIALALALHLRPPSSKTRQHWR